MTDHRIGDAAHQGASYPAQAPASHHDQTRVQFLPQPDYLLVGMSQPQMRPRGYSILRSDALRLLFNEFSGLLLCLLEAPVPPLSGEKMRVGHLWLGGHSEGHMKL